MTRTQGRAGSSGTPRSVDVARWVRSSLKTVSRALNNEADVARRRVSEAAGELGCRLNPAARALASGRTRPVSPVRLGTAPYGPASLLVGIEPAARDTGHAVRVVTPPDGDPGGINGAIGSLLDQGVVPFDAVAQEGLGLLPYVLEKPAVELLLAHDPPCDLVLRASTTPTPSRADVGGGQREADRSRRGRQAAPSTGAVLSAPH